MDPPCGADRCLASFINVHLEDVGLMGQCRSRDMGGCKRMKSTLFALQAFAASSQSASVGKRVYASLAYTRHKNICIVY